MNILVTSALGFKAKVDLFASMFRHLGVMDSRDSPQSATPTNLLLTGMAI